MARWGRRNVTFLHLSVSKDRFWSNDRNLVLILKPSPQSSIQSPHYHSTAHNTLQIHLHIFVSSTQLSWVIHSTDLVMHFEKVRRKSVAIKWGLYQWNMKRSTFAWLVFSCLLLQCYFLFLVQQQSTHVRHELIPERKTKIRGEFYHFLESVSQVFKENIEVKR